MFRILVALLSTMFLLTSCDKVSTFRHLVPHADAVFAEQFVGFLEVKNFDGAEAMMAPSTRRLKPEPHLSRWRPFSQEVCQMKSRL